MEIYQLGIDIGSTTAKLAILDGEQSGSFRTYRRHHAETLATLQEMLADARTACGDLTVDLLITGSAGMGVSEAFDLPFIQEVVASAELVHQKYPDVRTLIDIGGEDAKLIFFDPEGRPDIRMNGSCAGGTGAFIDEMAGLLNVPISDLDAMAARAGQIHPIASRCGVFAKTDLQNLLSRKIPKEDIAASIFHAIVLQTLATLARGYEPAAPLVFCGGPLTFMPELRKAFLRVMGFDGTAMLPVPHGEYVPATGAALAKSKAQVRMRLSELSARLEGQPQHLAAAGRRLEPLRTAHRVNGKHSAEAGRWNAERVPLSSLAGRPCFLGVDSGSTTMKVVLVDRSGRIAFSDYRPNNGEPVGTLRMILEALAEKMAAVSPPPEIVRSTVTGYGEDLVCAAFGFDSGIVETLAHFKAAKTLHPEVSFIMDIGGQDMKAIFVEDGFIKNIEINEACSSGCGTFIENFSRSMQHPVTEFAALAMEADAPCDLGTRCTVFMNSRVKQALREGATVGEISAGLAYSVVKNALHKVLKVRDMSALGDHIVVQGGTFRNPAVRRAFEQVTGRPVLCPDIAELMGAYGAALVSIRDWDPDSPGEGAFIGFDHLEAAEATDRRTIHCRGCENRCTVQKLIFPNGKVYFTGNRCENIYSNSGRSDRRGVSLTNIKEKLLFERETGTAGSPVLTVGIPRVLNMFQNYPFWNTLFRECGIRIVLSPPSSKSLYDEGAGTIASENICYPAKLVHGHVLFLIEQQVDRIFYPMVFYEDSDFPQAPNHYLCPIVAGYPDVLRSTVDPEGKHGVPFDSPAVNFGDRKLLRTACLRYLTSLGIPARRAAEAFKQAVAAQQTYKDDVRAAAAEILAAADAEGRPVVVLLGRPYHVDRQINHKIPDILVNFGVDVITEDAVPMDSGGDLENVQMLAAWEYPNRIYHAVQWAAKRPETYIVQFNSFGCGPDAFVVDEARDLAKEFGRGVTLLRIDEIESTGSAKLRLRSMLEIDRRDGNAVIQHAPRTTTPDFTAKDRTRTLIVPDFADFCTTPILRPVRDLGFQVESMPPTDRESVETGLKYANNEICYPGVIVVGDTIKALQSGRYPREDIAVGLWETGGQCRASCVFAATKKAMVQAGFEDVPLVTISTGGGSTNRQPGFDYSTPKLIYNAVIGMAYADAISAFYHSTAAREVHPGQAAEAAARFMAPLEDGRMKTRPKAVLEKLKQAVDVFNRIETRDIPLPKVGILGEIYVKYNRFSNFNVVPWLMSQGMEVVVPPLVEFFAGWFVGIKAHLRHATKRADLVSRLSGLLDRYLQSYLDDVGEVMEKYRYHLPQHTIHDVGAHASQVLSLLHQYGEGWLIAGEAAVFAETGVPNVLCLQPFGCIANHVIAKGVEKRLKGVYPHLNLLFLDTDHATSEVNFYNRLHFFVNNAHESARQFLFENGS